MKVLLILVIYLVAPSFCEDCRRIRDICYTSVVHTTSDINYNKAVNICKDRNEDIDPVNVRITSPGSFAEWFPGYLLTGKYLFEDFTNVWLTVFNDPDAAAQGMSNGEPIAQTYGVLCEMKLN
ncbi:uncharacterized protein LOC120331618 isoform X3 [Styela clava]